MEETETEAQNQHNMTEHTPHKAHRQYRKWKGQGFISCTFKTALDFGSFDLNKDKNALVFNMSYSFGIPSKRPVCQ